MYIHAHISSTCTSIYSMSEITACDTTNICCASLSMHTPMAKVSTAAPQAPVDNFPTEPVATNHVPVFICRYIKKKREISSHIRICFVIYRTFIKCGIMGLI